MAQTFGFMLYVLGLVGLGLVACVLGLGLAICVLDSITAYLMDIVTQSASVTAHNRDFGPGENSHGCE